jgi:riboflavin kinase/FMN adenylyltransferase
MQVYRSIHAISLPSSACAIGMFDGMHVGHRMVLENALREARLLEASSVVVSFANHPQFLISQTPTQLLSSLEERLAYFEQLGFDSALILDFDEWLMNLPAEEFIRQILLDRLHVKSVTVGYDHRFGKNRRGDGEMLKLAGQQYDFDVQIIDPVRLSTEPPEGAGQIVSSTLIRKLLAYGELEQANRLLGRPYSLTGMVEQGLQRGRQLGFPTANLAVEPHRLIPANGTYGGYADLNGTRYRAVCNIGLCPTFGDQAKKRVEIHLLDYSGDAFYGSTLQMHFLHKIREECKFPSMDALIHQIRQDCQWVQCSVTLPTPSTVP